MGLLSESRLQVCTWNAKCKFLQDLLRGLRKIFYESNHLDTTDKPYSLYERYISFVYVEPT